MAKLKKGVEKKLSKPKAEAKVNADIANGPNLKTEKTEDANLKTESSSLTDIISGTNNQKASPQVSRASYYSTYGALFVLILFVFGYAGFSMFTQTAGKATGTLTAEQTSQAEASLQQPNEIKPKQEAQLQTPVRQEEMKQETLQKQLPVSKNKKPMNKAILATLAVILAAIGSMLAFIYLGKPGPLPAPPIIAKKEEEIIAKKGYGQLKEDDELFEV